MDEKPVAPDAPVPEVDDDLPPPVPLPRWVPILIGLILLGMAGLAVWTGLRYRNAAFAPPLLKASQQQTPRRESGGAPGEPQAGASRVAHGEYGEDIPSPNTADLTDKARYSITNTGGSLLPSVRLAAKRGLMIDVQPPDAIVYVNEKPIGEAKQFSQPDDVYEFADEGSYTVRIVADGFQEAEFVVIARADAKDEVAVIKTVLQPGTVSKAKR
jgi:hypothetical protein